MNCKKWWDSGKHYPVVLQYFSGCSAWDLNAAYPDVRWKLRRLEHIPHLREVNRVGNLIASVCTASSDEALKNLEPLIKRKAADAMVSYADIPGDVRFEQRRELLVIKLKSIMSRYLPKCVMEFPPTVTTSALLQLFLGPKDMHITDYIDTVKSVQGALPGGALGYKVTSAVYATDWQTMCSIIRQECILWPGENNSLETISCDLELSRPSVLIDGENMQVDVIDHVLSDVLLGIDSDQQRIVIFDSEAEKQLQYNLLQMRHPQVRIKYVSRVGNGKSQVDFYLQDEIHREHSENHCQSFIIVSSDSDYASLLQRFPTARFTYLVQRSITSRIWREKMEADGIPHIYLDESMHSWNLRVFNTEVVFMQGQKLKRTEIEDSNSWNEFVSQMPSYGAAVFDTARRRLLSQWEE